MRIPSSRVQNTTKTNRSVWKMFNSKLQVQGTENLHVPMKCWVCDARVEGGSEIWVSGGSPWVFIWGFPPVPGRHAPRPKPCMFPMKGDQFRVPSPNLRTLFWVQGSKFQNFGSQRRVCDVRESALALWPLAFSLWVVASGL